MRKLLPHPLLSIVILLTWLALVREASPGHLLLGALIGIVIPRFTLRFSPEPALVLRTGTALRLLLTVIYDIVIANLAVARLVLGPRSRLHPAFIEVPLDTRHPFAVGLLASIITMTPGTVSCDVDHAGRRILVHALNAPEPAMVIAAIKARYERPLREIFGC